MASSATDRASRVIPPVRIGTAGWALPRATAAAFPSADSVLARYAQVFSTVEINSTFYREHRPATFARWRDAVPATFRFAVKLPRAMTHDAQLAVPRAALAAWLQGVGELGDRLGPLLVQLAPGHAFVRRRASTFFAALRALHAGPVVLEPRHASWFEPAVTTLLEATEVSRVVADPPRPEGLAASPAGAPATLYLRLHGSPQMYRSSYADGRLEALAARIAHARAEVYCIFDNTAVGAATSDALALLARLKSTTRDGACTATPRA